ncbi:MAG: DUF4440 domain-containing protein [Armatimonadetes bacterium]|nr:DUF4440 domain-containing protein [Armatimonadota bacterium]CUU37301.1 Ketosteroid isomerase homolog [Armatimonadetes bacterium DC]
MTRTRAAIAVGAVLIILLGLRLTLFNQPPPIPPQERIQQMFREGKAAFEAKDVDALMAMLADDFEWDGMDKQRLRLQLVQFFRNINNPRARYKEPLQIEVFGAKAIARTEVSISWDEIGPNAQRYGPLEVEFRKEQGRRWGLFPYEEWKVVRVNGLTWETILGL